MIPIRYSRGTSQFDNKPSQREAADFDAFADGFLADRAATKGKTYICAPMDGFKHFAACWAIEHWRMRCHKAEVLGAALVANRRGDDFEKADDLLYAHERAESCLLALDAALVAICAEHGLDAADVRRMAGTEAFNSRRKSAKPDADYLAAVQSALAEIAAAE
jgi:hypothetical protein